MASFQPREITFEQIRANDELLITVKNGSLTTTKQGVAFVNLEGSGGLDYWMTEDEFTLVSERDIPSGAEITLLNRKLPDKWEADQIGSLDNSCIEVDSMDDGRLRVSVSNYDDGAVVALTREQTIELRDYLTTVLEG